MRSGKGADLYGRGGGGGGGGGFGPPLTPMVKKLLIAHGVIWLLQGAAPMLTDLGAVSTGGVFQAGFIWQPFTYMWLHAPPPSMAHLAFNMFTLWMFGGQLEAVWGSRRFLRFYIVTGTGAGAIILVWHLMTMNPYPTLGASGAIFGLLTAFSLLWPDRRIMLLFPPIPIKAIWFIPLLFVLQAFMGGGGNISHVGHLGGVIVAGIILRKQLSGFFSLKSLRYRWHRYRMRGRLKAVRREEWERHRGRDDDRRDH